VYGAIYKKSCQSFLHFPFSFFFFPFLDLGHWVHASICWALSLHGSFSNISKEQPDENHSRGIKAAEIGLIKIPTSYPFIFSHLM
jgi:hypothetical protein